MWLVISKYKQALLVFLILGIILLVKLIGITKEAKKIIVTGQSIAEKADDVVDNVKDMTSIGGVVKTFANRYTNTKSKKGK